MHGAKLFRDLLARLHVGIRPPVTCIPDGVMSLTLQVAEEMSIPALVFRTTSACGFMGTSTSPSSSTEATCHSKVLSR
jgi:hypothetical protein